MVFHSIVGVGGVSVDLCTLEKVEIIAGGVTDYAVMLTSGLFR
jgi:hypothetical protein